VILTCDRLEQALVGCRCRYEDEHRYAYGATDKHKISGCGGIAVPVQEGNKAVYDRLCPREHGASVKGLALGMAGDGPVSELAESLLQCYAAPLRNTSNSSTSRICSYVYGTR
jgi:hypothetical protein